MQSEHMKQMELLPEEQPQEPVKITPKTNQDLRRILQSQYGPRVIEFMRDMIVKLDKNAHKGSWEGLNKDDTFFRMIDEVMEIRNAIRRNEPVEDQKFECADVANFAFILWDICDLGQKDACGRRPDDPNYGLVTGRIPTNQPYEG